MREHRVLLAWIDEFGINNTFCFYKQYGQIRLGAIVEQDYVNPASFRHALVERLEGFFSTLSELDCIVAAAYISSDFLSEGMFNHLNELVSSVFYLNKSQLLRDEIRSHTTKPIKEVNTLYSAVSVHDAEAASLALNRIIGHLLVDMPDIATTNKLYLELMWNCAVIIGKRDQLDFRPMSIAIESLDDFRAMFEGAVIMAMKSEPVEAPTSPLCNVIQRIRDNPERSVNIDQVAGELNFSRSHFCRLFRKETDMSFTEFLTKARVTKACDLFEHTHMSVSDVASLVGYSNVYYFKQTFFKEVGMDIELWRSEHCH